MVIPRVTIGVGEGRAANSLDVMNFLDPTDEEYRCFICDEVIIVVTTTTKKFIASRIGQLVGKKQCDKTIVIIIFMDIFLPSFLTLHIEET